MILSNKCVLNDRYVIQSVLGEVGPFDVKYLAWDLQSEEEVVIREYYPLSLAMREQGGTLLEVHDPGRFEYGLGAYTAEGLQLGKISHEAVASHIEQFKQNGTVYCVEEYVPGASLSAYVMQQGGRISEEQAVSITSTILKGLQACHANRLYHGGISPKSVFLTADGRPILLGFQGARYKLARECESLSEITNPGYTAPEQFAYKVEEGPWWDIYGCAATLHFMMSGQHLPALDVERANEQVSAAIQQTPVRSLELRDALIAGLSFEHRDRPRSAQAFIALLEEAHRAAALDIQGSDGLPRLEIGFEPTISATAQEDHYTQEASYSQQPRATHTAPASSTRIKEVQEQVEHEISDVIPQDLPQLPSEPRQLLAAGYNAEVPAANNVVREKELELLLAKMVKGQQVFVAFILGLVFLVLLVVIGGIFFRPAFLQQLGMQSAQAESEEPLEEVETNPGPSDPGDALNAGAALAATSVLPGEEDEESIVVDDQTYGDLFEPEEEADSQTESAEEDEPSDSRNRSQASEEEDDPQTEAEEADEQQSEAASTSTSNAVDASENEENIAEQDSSTFERIQINPEVEAALERERQYLYYRSQGDSLASQGFTMAALQWYKSAQRYKEGDAYVENRIRTMTDSLEAISTAQAIADSLAARLEQVRDGNGIFVLPDVPVRMVDEKAVRESIVYPIGAVQSRTEGRVTIRFVIDEQGNMGDYRIIRGIGAGCDETVLKALQSASFEAAQFNGEAVKSWAIFSTVFKL